MFTNKTHCKKCIFYTPECLAEKCEHYYVSQAIFDRAGAVFGHEILSRRKSTTSSSMEDYFNKMTDEARAKIFIDQMLLISVNTNFSKNNSKIFLNIDRSTLLQVGVPAAIKIFSNLSYSLGKEVIFEITERFKQLDHDIANHFFELIDSNVKLAADDYSIKHPSHLYIEHYSYIKIDMDEIKLQCHEDFECFISILCNFKSNGSMLIAEKIQTESDYYFSKLLPFDYFQGYYLDAKYSIGR